MMILKDWKPRVSGSLRGFVEVELDIGLIILDIRIFDGRDGAYTLLPDKPSIKDGRQQYNADQQPIYYPALKWRDRKTGDKFSSAVIRLLLEKYPNALGSRRRVRPAAGFLCRTAHGID
jgi:DNA-binding cell septation regulator SpoVG